MANDDHTIKLSKAEIKTVLKGLGKLPFEDVYTLIEKIIKQTAIPGHPPKETEK